MPYAPWIDRFVTQLTQLQPALPPELAKAVAIAEYVDSGWKIEPEEAASHYAVRKERRRWRERLDQ